VCKKRLCSSSSSMNEGETQTGLGLLITLGLLQGSFKASRGCRCSWGQAACS
jgi:hypothetical protein